MTMHRLNTIALVLTLVAALAFLVMTPFSYFRYTAIGFDTDQPTEQGILHRSYRLRWPGNGSVRLDYASRLFPAGSLRIDTLDPAARFFQPPRTKWAGSRCVWYEFTCGSQHPDDRRELAWIAAPSWTPGAFLFVLVGCGWYWRRRAQPRAARDSPTPAEPHA